MFKVGDEVICINDSEPAQQPPNMVVKGQRYTVTGFNIGFMRTNLGAGFVMVQPELCLYVGEVPSQRGFYAFRFRKVDKPAKDTDISIFKEIADGTRVVPLEPIEPVKIPEKAE